MVKFASGSLLLSSLNGSLSSGLSGDLLNSLGLRGSSGDNAESVLLGGLVGWDRGGVVGGGSVVHWGGVVDGSGVVGGLRTGLVHNGGGLVGHGGGSRLVGGSRGGLVGGGGSGLVGGSGGGDVGLCLGVHGLSLVLDIGNISVRASTVGNNLYSAIRKVHSVLTSGVVVGPLLLLGENGTVMRIVDSILVLK